MTSDRSTPCGNCGCRRDDHFESKGVCDLGFCSALCSTFEEPHDDIDLPLNVEPTVDEPVCEACGAPNPERTKNDRGVLLCQPCVDDEIEEQERALDLADYEPCCRAYTQRLGGGDHEWGCPNY